MNGIPILSLLVAAPLLSGAAVACLPARRRDLLLGVSLALSLLILAVSLPLLARFDPATPHLQFYEASPWIPTLDVGWRAGIDGFSLFLVLLTAFLFPAVFYTAGAVKAGLKSYLVALFALEAGCLGAFVALDLALFYVFFELVLLPMALLVFAWGGERRVYAGVKFFLFTMAGSVLLLFALLALPYLHYQQHGAFTTDLTRLYGLAFPSLRVECLLFLLVSAAFAIKVPLVPLHTWLPDAHTEAPTGGSVILAGVLLKIGGYGFLRFAIPLFPHAAALLAPLFVGLGALGVVYGALAALVQPDLKRLVAYSSVSHMGYVAAGLFAMNAAGIMGASVQMLAHGLSTGALFLLVGLLYERRHTRLIRDFGGVATAMPRYAVIFILVTLASIGLPGLAGFAGEFLVLAGAYRYGFGIGLVCTLGALLSAAYMLWAVERVLFGRLDKPENKALADLSIGECLPFLPILALALLLGVYPAVVTDRMKASVGHLARAGAGYTLEVAGGRAGAPPADPEKGGAR